MYPASADHRLAAQGNSRQRCRLKMRQRSPKLERAKQTFPAGFKVLTVLAFPASDMAAPHRTGPTEHEGRAADHAGNQPL